jgi:Domain of unknown function (DUF4062)
VKHPLAADHCHREAREVSGTTTAIRTPDQRLRVFVSSTLGELAPERKAVSRAISALGLTPVLFDQAFAAGTRLSQREAVAAVRERLRA